jgi:hypothetical protein
MRKLIIITYYFSRKENIGSIRLQGLAKYLPRFGWNPTIITVQQHLSTEPSTMNRVPYQIVETEYEDINASLASLVGIDPHRPVKESLNLKDNKDKKTIFDHIWSLTRELLYYPDAQKGWYKHGFEAGEKILREGNYEAVISSSSPITSHLIARDLKKRYNIPWIADLRDLWTQNHYYPYSPTRRQIDTLLEKKTLRVADALTTVSQPLTDKLYERYPDKYISTITNGFDTEEINPGIPLSKDFTITYTGALYKGRRDPEPLLKALNELIHDGEVAREDISINFYGRRESWLNEDIERYKLGDIVSLHGPVSRELAIKKQWESQILLLLTWDNPSEKGVYTGKVFDYLAARRPILSLGLSEGVVPELLSNTNTGIHALTEEEIKLYLLRTYTDFKKNGVVRYEGIQSEIDKYSHYEMARKFAEILDFVAK